MTVAGLVAIVQKDHHDPSLFETFSSMRAILNKLGCGLVANGICFLNLIF